MRVHGREGGCREGAGTRRRRRRRFGRDRGKTLAVRTHAHVFSRRPVLDPVACSLHSRRPLHSVVVSARLYRTRPETPFSPPKRPKKKKEKKNIVGSQQSFTSHNIVILKDYDCDLGVQRCKIHFLLRSNIIYCTATIIISAHFTCI